MANPSSSKSLDKSLLDNDKRPKWKFTCLPAFACFLYTGLPRRLSGLLLIRQARKNNFILWIEVVNRIYIEDVHKETASCLPGYYNKRVIRIPLPDVRCTPGRCSINILVTSEDNGEPIWWPSVCAYNCFFIWKWTLWTSDKVSIAPWHLLSTVLPVVLIPVGSLLGPVVNTDTQCRYKPLLLRHLWLLSEAHRRTCTFVGACPVNGLTLVARCMPKS